MRISDWSSDVCSSDLLAVGHIKLCPAIGFDQIVGGRYKLHILCVLNLGPHRYGEIGRSLLHGTMGRPITPRILSRELKELEHRSEEHTSELQSLMRISYAVFCLKKNK